MRILFLAHRLPYPPNKGDKIRSFWELSTLSKRHDVDLFCFYDDPKDSSEIENLRSYCDSCYAEPIDVIGSRLRAVSALVGGRSFSTSFFFSSTMTKRVAEAVHTRSYDLVFVFGSSMAQYAEPWPNLPRILDLVDVDSDKWTQYSSYSRGPLSWLWLLEGRRLGQYESILVRGFSNTLVCTEGEGRLLRSKVKQGTISVMQNSLDMDYFAPETVSLPEKIRSLQPYVIFTGSMDYFPNIDAVEFFCQEILPRIRLSIPNLHFVIAGRNPSPRVKRLETENAVEVTGSLPDIRPYLHGAAVAVAPMRIARGVQNKILEALAMDVPVVASSVAADALPRELAVLLAAESDAESLAARVTGYVLDPPVRTGARRASVKRYIESLELPSQLEGFLRSAVAQSTGAQQDQVEVAV
jgi:sugar transferase (PEP-CTERM/EpsH1 system associated)